MKTPQRYVFEYVKGMWTLVPIEKTPARDLDSTAGVILAKDFVVALQEAKQDGYNEALNLHSVKAVKRKVAQLKQKMLEHSDSWGSPKFRVQDTFNLIDEVFGNKVGVQR